MKYHPLKYFLCIFLLIYFTCAFTDISYASDAFIDADVYASQVAPLDVVSLSTGPRHEGIKGLRISILVAEVYHSVVVEEISYGLTEGDENKIIKSYFIEDLLISRHVGTGPLVNLDFVKWISWDEFELKEGDKHFRIRYMNDGKFKVSTQETLSNAEKNDLNSAQFALNNYLKALELNQFKKCNEFFSEKLLRKIQQEADSCERFLKASEEYYRKPVILEVKTVDGEYVFKVKMGIDGPGYKSCAIKTYHMIFQGGKWKIKEWKIENTNEIPINVDSAVYCYK